MSRERDDHLMLELVPDPNTKSGNVVRALAPSDVLYVPDVTELELLLQHYSIDDPKVVVSDNPFARRWYVEKIRPALRYYCQKFSTEEPVWLAGDEKYQEMEDAEKKELFGHAELSIREFRRLVSTQEPGQEQND